MADPITDRFDTYEPDDEDDDYTWEEDTYRDPKPNVLWGRVAILGGLLLLAFLFGRVTKPAGVPLEDLQRAQARVETLRTENSELKTELAAQESEPAPVAEPEDAAAETEDSEAAEATDTEDQIYTVQSGDSLTIIAQRFYGDTSLSDFLAEANNIADPTKISVGQKLRIPPNPNDN